MQVYRGLDIGTAKPDNSFLKKLTHHLINIIDPDEQFSAGEFVSRSDRLLKEIFQRGKIPIIAGGTAFYFRNFLFGLPNAPPSIPKIREKLIFELKERGLNYLYTELSEVDPVSAERISENDSYRILRALEVFRFTGNPLSSFRIPSILRDNFIPLLIGLKRDRPVLYERINLRVLKMFENGLAAEIKQLLSSGYQKDDPGMKGIGYKEFFLMQKCGCYTLNEIIEIIQMNSRRYAKRQITFFKNLPNINWFHPEEIDSISELIGKFIETAGSGFL